MTDREEETSNIASEPIDVAQESMDAPQEPADVEQDPVDVEQDPVDVEQDPVDVEQGPEPIDVPQEESKDEEDGSEVPMKYPGATSIDGPGVDPAERKNMESQDPALKEEQPKKKKPKREINPDYKDVHETGKWGQISRKEMYIVLLVVVLVVAGVVAAVVVLTGKDDDDKVITAPPLAEKTEAPTAAPIILAPEDSLIHMLAAIDKNNVAFTLIDDALPAEVEDVASYEGLQDDPTATPASRAMSWLFFTDGQNVRDELIYRWALASIYYSMGGENWLNQDNWLSDKNICEWHGLDCDAFDVLREIDLSNNNVAGEVPLEFAMLETVQAIALRRNQISGELNGKIFGFLPRLTILYLENNQLSGTVPESLRDNGVLRK
jgi:hypothetical protein